MLDNVFCLGHSTIKINKNGKVIYIDPYNIKEDRYDADIIFITHNHYDHFSKDDIEKIRKQNTIIVLTEDILSEALELGFLESNIIKVKPNNSYCVENINFMTVASYNINKNFHPKDNNWVGYILVIDGIRYYIMGDTDVTLESKNVKCDVLFVPVGGTYTMNYEEAALLTNEIEPKMVVPIHYGVLVGTKSDALNFKKLLKGTIKCEIMY